MKIEMHTYGFQEMRHIYIYSFISNKLRVNNQLHIHIANSKCNLVVVAREDTVSSNW